MKRSYKLGGAFFRPLYALAIYAALSMLAGCGGGSSSLTPSAPSNSAGVAPLSSHYQVLYRFQGGTDGVTPFASLLFENGQLYGTTFNGGTGNGDGTAFKLSTSGTKTTLYSFQGGTDAAGPEAGLTADSGGVLYGDTVYGGGGAVCPAAGCGTVYELVPNGSGYTEKVLYAFQGGSDGSAPVGNILVDQRGALYGTTIAGGGATACDSYSGIGCGTVFKLTPSSSGYTENILYSFQAGDDGVGPAGTLIEDANGRLYGTTDYGGGASACSSPSGNAGCGTVFKLTPSGSGFTESVIYRFQGGTDGSIPRSGLLAGSNGALFGSTVDSGANGRGTVYELTPSGSAYSEQTIFSFEGADGAAPEDLNSLYTDSRGNLYGTTVSGGERKYCVCGTVFKLALTRSGYSEATLHKFKGTRAHDGMYPQASLTADSAGALYGTTTEGGLRKGHGYGIVFKILP